MAVKADLIKELVEKYGYDENEIKNYTNAKLQQLIKQEETDAKELAKEETETAKVDKKEAKRQFKREDKILVMNGTNGTLIYISPTTGQEYRFEEFGQTDEIEYGELIKIRNQYPRFISEGWMIILDDDVVKEFRLEEMYQNILTPENLDEMFTKSVDEIDSFLSKVPKGMLQTFVMRAIQLYRENKLHDLRIIKYVEEKFNISFEEIV